MNEAEARIESLYGTILTSADEAKVNPEEFLATLAMVSGLVLHHFARAEDHPLIMTRFRDQVMGIASKFAEFAAATDGQNGDTHEQVP